MTINIPAIDTDADTLTAGFAYAKAGLYTVPIKAGTKNPGSVLGKGWERQSSREAEVLAAWFAGTDHGIAIHAGRSGLVVLDVDHPDRLPEALRRAIDECNPPYQSTRPDVPEKGHYLFATPPGRVLGNGTGKLGGEWGEIRGLNGVIVVAPSIHPDGGEYRWIRTGPVPELPAYVDELLGEATPGMDAATDAEVRAFLTEHTGATRPELLDGWVTTFEAKVAAGESRHMRMLSVAAGAFAEARAGYFPARAAMERLEAAFLAAVTREPVPGSQQGRARGGGMAASEWMGISAWAVAQANATDIAAVRERVAEKMPDGDDLSWIPGYTGRGAGGEPPKDEEPGDRPRDQSPAKPGIDITHEPDAIRRIVKIIQYNAYLPGLYTREGQLVTVEEGTSPDGDHTISVEMVREDKLRRLLADHTDCYKVVKRKDDFEPIPALPALATARAVLASTEWGKVPPLAGVVRAPVLRPDGTVLQQPGYDPATGIYLCDEVTMPAVPERPSQADVDAAKQLLLGAVLVDFPWVTDADRANYIALLLTPLLRPYVRGLSPLGAISAPERGTGKTLLADVIMSLYGGLMRVMSENDEELRKAITATLRGTEPVIVFDNIPARAAIASPVLAQAITTKRWSDRLLGASEDTTLANDRLWIATGTNIKLGGDFAQRTVLVRIDPRQPRPDRRGGFALDPLDEWVIDNRGALLHALLVLTRAWVAAGAPAAKGLRMRSFTKWAAALGGLLTFHGVSGFLGNRDEVDVHDEDAEVWSAFLAAWYARYGDAEQKVTAIRADADVYGTVNTPWTEAFPRGRDERPVSAKTLGSMLRERNGRFYGGFRLDGRWDSHGKAWLWRVSPFVEDVPLGGDSTHTDENMRAGDAGDRGSFAGHFSQPQNDRDQCVCGSCGSCGSSATYTSREDPDFSRNRAAGEPPASPASPAASSEGAGQGKFPVAGDDPQMTRSMPETPTSLWPEGTIGAEMNQGGAA